MIATDDFMTKFDDQGCFRDGGGELTVVFATKGGSRFPGKLQFKSGLCVRAAMDSGGDWELPDHAPLNNIHFLLDVGDEKLYEIVIDQGRIIPLDEAPRHSTKRDFLRNLRIARNLFVHSHPEETRSPATNVATSVDVLARAAIWLTPKSVAGFNAADFAELGHDRQAELQNAVQNFLAVATQVPADRPASNEQYGIARIALAKILQILAPHLPVADESKQVETALRSIDFPSWVVNWDYELDSDSDNIAAVWVNVFADEQSVPWTQLGREALKLTMRVRQALADFKVERRPYIRMRTAVEHKAG